MKIFQKYCIIFTICFLFIAPASVVSSLENDTEQTNGLKPSIIGGYGLLLKVKNNGDPIEDAYIHFVIEIWPNNIFSDITKKSTSYRKISGSLVDGSIVSPGLPYREYFGPLMLSMMFDSGRIVVKIYNHDNTIAYKEGYVLFGLVFVQ
jgi:hypothetical protein